LGGAPRVDSAVHFLGMQLHYIDGAYINYSPGNILAVSLLGMALISFYRYFSVPPSVNLSNKQRELLGMAPVSEEIEQTST
jgi:hypothetical protein